MTNLTASPPTGTPSPSDAFSAALNALVGNAAARLERTVSGWADKLDGVTEKATSTEAVTRLADEGLDELAESGGATSAAGAKGAQAGIHGKNPAWAAVKSAWQAGTPVVRAAIITASASAVLLLVLSPALLLVFLLSLLVLAAVRRARRAKP